MGMGIMPKMGHTLPRLGFKKARPDGDRGPANSLNFEENYAQPSGLENGPFRHPIDDKGELDGIQGRAGDDFRNGTYSAAIRV